jgi:chemotaxis protein CheC
MSSTEPTDAQLDALREVANIGCGHAANALSRLVGGRQVQIEVPRVVLADCQKMQPLLGESDATVVATALEIRGALQGQLLLVLQEDDAHRLSSELLAGQGAGFNQAQLGALEEAGNIVACACLNAIGKFTGLTLLPSTPHIHHERVEEMVARVVEDAESAVGLVMVLEARFSTTSGPRISGQVLLIPRRSSVRVLLDKLGV